MNEVTVSQDDRLLIAELSDNEYDIVGLANFAIDDDTVNRCLRSLYSIVRDQRRPESADRTRLAHVLLGMVTVARQEYAADGKQEYWPFLFDRIHRARFADPEQFRLEVSSGQRNQGLLGEWFRAALEEFDYGIPTEGNTNIAPVVFHSGIPVTSLGRVLGVIAVACETYGPQATSLPADLRRLLVQNYQPRLHVNVERLLASSLLGANQLWTCLSRVVHAWQTRGDCSLELQQLPQALDPGEVRDALPTRSSVSRAARIELPVLRFDPETGEVRLTVPSGTRADWSILTGRTAVEVLWTQTHLGWTAEFRRPLPESLEVSHIDHRHSESRLFETRPEFWPGHWFHAHNGNLEDGRVIDANGIQPGRWFVLFEGTPTFCSIPYVRQVRLQWSWLAGSTEWTAWEILVPPRAANRTELQWRVGTNSFSIPLARRPGARVEVVSESVCCATTDDGQEVQVFRGAPTVRLQREKPLEMLLLAEGTASPSIVIDLTVSPQEALQIPVSQPGVYQLREKRGVGRTLLRFALLPEIEVEGPDVDRESGMGCVCLKSQDGIGAFSTTTGNSIVATNGWYTHEFSTVEPYAEVKWCWNSIDAPDLLFRWPIEAVRWRVLGLSDELATWTREPLVISPSKITKNDVEFEIQYPCDAELLVNDRDNSAKTQPGPSGTAFRLPLFAYKGAEGIVFKVDGVEHSAILFSDRPLLSSLTCLADGNSVLIEWTAITPLNGCSLVVWNACDVLSEPRVVSLRPDQIAGSYAEVSFSELPDADVFAASLLRSVGGMLRKIHHFAASRKDELRPVGVCINRKTGRSHSADEAPQSWDQFLFQASLQRRFGVEKFQEWAAASLKALHANGEFSLSRGLKLCKSLHAYSKDQKLSERDRVWAQSLSEALLSRFRAARPDELLDAFGPGQPDFLTELLDLGIPAGQRFPLKSFGIEATDRYDSAYPVQYLRDLWLVSICRNQDSSRNAERLDFPKDFQERQKQAASRILQFHDEHELPSPFLFLPLARRTAKIHRSSCGHRHEFALPSVSADGDRCERFQELLGLLDRPIDCNGTHDDQFFQVRGRAKRANSDGPAYSLYWASAESRWQVDSSKLCCYSAFQPLVTKEWLAAEVAKSFDLHNLLNRWAKDHPVPPEECFRCLEPLSDKLKRDKVSGELHKEVLRPPQKEIKYLHGVPVQATTVSSVSDASAICWQMAWIERLTSLKGSNQFFGGDEQSSVEFQKALSKSLLLWPELMRRSLSLAEMLILTLYGGGIGVAAKFAGPLPIPTYESVKSTAASAVNAAVDHSMGTIRKNVSGIVVGYDYGTGILLIPREGVTVESALGHFFMGKGDRLYQLVRFNRIDVPKDDRDCLDAVHLERKKKSRQANVSLADVYCGRSFLCDVSGVDVWEISSLRLQERSPQRPIPNDLRKRIE